MLTLRHTLAMYILFFGKIMSKALPIVVAAVLAGASLVPIFLASKDPAKFQASTQRNQFDTKNASAIQKISYVLGYEVTSKMTPPELDVNAFAAGAKAGHGHEAVPYTNEELNAAYLELIAQQQSAQTTAAKPSEVTSPPESTATDENKQFLVENAKKPGVITTASGLQYSIEKQGTGKQPKATDTVEVNYEGKLVNGQVFDSSFARGQPISFALNQVIPGWTEGLQLMKEGAVYTFYIPAQLGYGAQDMGTIPANSTLIFKVELLAVK